MALSLALPAWPSRHVLVATKRSFSNSKKKNAKQVQVLVVCLKKEGTTTAFDNSPAF